MTPSAQNNSPRDSSVGEQRDDSPQTEHTHFGFRTVASADKAGLVGDVFRSVATRYDLMNDLMSLGAHRLWKRFAASQSALRPGDIALDVAGGSGDMARRFAEQVGTTGMVVLTDINAAMLTQGKQNMINAGLVGNVDYALSDAEKLCFTDSQFHCACIAFGLRNVTHKQDALNSLYRVIRAGGRLLILEFSKPLIPALEKVYDLYSFHAIPALGKLVTGDQESYQYLVESIRKFPHQQELKTMMQRAGFEDIKIHNLSGGIVALHIGFKY